MRPRRLLLCMDSDQDLLDGPLYQPELVPTPYLQPQLQRPPPPPRQDTGFGGPSGAGPSTVCIALLLYK